MLGLYYLFNSKIIYPYGVIKNHSTLNMSKYKVFWEVSKYAIVEADNATEATEKVMAEDIEQFEDEITAPPEAIKMDKNYKKLYGKRK